MKCKHGLESDTCSLCLGYKRSKPDGKGMKGRDNLVQHMTERPRLEKKSEGKEFYQLRHAMYRKADDFYEEKK